MVRHNENPMQLAIAVSVDAAAGVTTGISAADRSTTIRLLATPTAVADDFSRPGHVFPLRAVDGGVLARPSYPEAVVDLTRLAPGDQLRTELLDETGLPHPGNT